MRTRDDIESYLTGSGYSHEEVADGTWMVQDPESPAARIVVRLESDLVVFRLMVMPLGKVKKREQLFEELLRLNVSDMVHGAYGISDDTISMTCALRLENLDLNELRGTLDDFTLALSRHREVLSSYC
ncbi:MAG: YbjN domain-containing protein [Myxococcales bacterium]|nr:YbjN domain-containing protein [Myxococcales bacterium]